MSLYAYMSFAVAMFFLALSPGPGLAAIVSRTLSAGRAAGFRMVAGVVLVDFLFLALAMAGLSAVAAMMGPLFALVKYGAAAYLVWLGIKAWRTAGAPITAASQRAVSGRRDVLLGVLVTLGNPKAILFYSALLPTFLDVAHMDLTAYLICCLIITPVMVIVCGGYILAADRSRKLFADGGRKRLLDRGIGSLLVGSGVLVASR